MRRVLVALKFLRRDVAAKMVVTTRGQMAGPEHFFILDVSSRNRQHLRAETEFAKHTRHGIIRKLGIVFINRALIAGDEFGLGDATSGHGEFTERAVLVFQREGSFSTRGHEVNLARWQVRNIRRIPLAEAVALLRLLAAQFKTHRHVGSVLNGEIDFHPVSTRHGTTQLFSIDADELVIDRETGIQNDVIHTMQGRTTEAVLLRKRRKRRSGGKGRDAEDDVVVRINVLLETQFFASHIHTEVRQIEVAARRLRVGKHFAACQCQLFSHAILQPQMKVLMCSLLDGPRRIFQERIILGFSEIWQVDKDADFAAERGLEHGAEQA